MLKRQLIFFALFGTPVGCFAMRLPILLTSLPLAAIGAWWVASPVSYPRWVLHGLIRAVPLAAVESLALWWLSR